MRQSANLYVYAQGNPLLFVDVSGLWCCHIHFYHTSDIARRIGFVPDSANTIAQANKGVDSNISYFGIGSGASRRFPVGILGTGPFPLVGTQEYHFDMSLPWQTDSRVTLSQDYLNRAVSIVLDAQNVFDVSMAQLDDFLKRVEQGCNMLPVLHDPSDVERDWREDAYQEYLFALNRALNQLGRGLHPLQDIYAHGDMGNALLGDHAVLPFIFNHILYANPNRRRIMNPNSPAYAIISSRHADIIGWEWIDPNNRVGLVYTGEGMAGNRVIETSLATITFMESFLDQTGLRYSTRLSYENRVWRDPTI